jgi:PAS domain S-box-containing protein
MISPRTRSILLLAIPVLAAGLFMLDWFTPLGLMDWVLYIIPLMLSFYAARRPVPYLLAAVFSALTLAGIYLSSHTAFQHLGYHLRLADDFLSTGTLWVVAFMVVQHRRTVDETLKLSRAIEHTPASIVITDRAGNITYVNPKFTEVTGYAPGEVLGKNPRLLKSGETPPAEYERLWKTITAGEEWRGTFHNRKKNGELFWEAAAIGPVLNEAGQLTHYLAVKEDITERRRAEDALRESELRYRSLFENMLEGFAYCQMVYADGQPVDFIYLTVNRAFEKITGLKEVAGKKVTEIIPGIQAAHPELFEIYGRVTATGQPERFEIYLESLQKWLEISVHGAGQGHFAAAFEDITERKQMERLLEFVAREGWSGPPEDFLARLVEHIGRTLAVDYVFVGRLKDAQTVQTAGLYAKGRIAPDIEYTTRGAPCRNVIGQTLCHHCEKLQELFPDDPLLAEMGAQSYLAIPLADSAGQPLGLLAVLDTKPMPDARLATALLRIAAVRAAGELEQQAAAAALQASENRYRQLVELSPDAVFIQCDGRFVFVNSAGLKLFGAERPEQILHRPVMDFIHPKHREKVAARVAALRDERIPAPLLEEQYLRLDMTTVEVEVLAIPFTFQGQPAAQVIVRDITERKKLENQLLRMQRMESIGTLAGGIAHDLNNVLAPLMFAIDLLRDKITDAEGQKLLQMLETNVQRAASLVKQVLTFGRGIQGERVPVSPIHLVREIGKMIHETFPKSITFESHAAPDLWTVTGDATQLHQVLLNLCVNARDAMPHGGKLSIELANVVLDENYTGMNLEAKPGPYVAIKVADTGTGIPQEIQDKIFDPFFTTKELGKGTGLGLSTVLGIVKSHDGFVHCYSEVGKGSTFKAYFPANATPAAAENAAVAQTGLPRGHDELVLVVDDEEPIRKVVQSILERFGYRVLLAANGAEALALYARHRAEIALVITDMMMPVMDGPATIVALMAMNPQVKIIGSSGQASNGGVAKAVNAGVKHFVPKPYSAEAMLRALHEVLH